MWLPTMRLVLDFTQRWVNRSEPIEDLVCKGSLRACPISMSVMNSSKALDHQCKRKAPSQRHSHGAPYRRPRYFELPAHIFNSSTVWRLVATPGRELAKVLLEGERLLASGT